MRSLRPNRSAAGVGVRARSRRGRRLPVELAQAKLPARRRAIGSANAAEFFVAVAISLGFLIHRHAAPLDLYAVVGLLIGGVVVAPVAALQLNPGNRECAAALAALSTSAVPVLAPGTAVSSSLSHT